MCNSFVFTSWEAACVDAVMATGLAVPALVILNDSMFAPARVPVKQIRQASYIRTFSGGCIGAWR